MTVERKIIDIETWERRDYYQFFGNMPDPYFGMTAKVDFTKCYNEAKSEGGSFFLYYLYQVLTAIKNVPELCCRIENGQVVQYSYVGVSSTVGRSDGSFGYSYIEYYAEREKFITEAAKEIARVKAGHGLMINSQEQRVDTVYFTAIPWVDFTDIKHPGGNRPGDSVPKIAVGKLVEESGRKLMSVEIEVNHGLADGRHLAEFFAGLSK